MRLSTEKTKRVLVPNDPDDGYVIIRALSVEELSEIESKSSTVSVSEGKAQVVVNSYDRINGVARGCIKGWGNMFDAAGTELKFNAGNLEKVKKFNISVDSKKIRFFQWIDEEHAKFIEEVSEEIGAAQEN